MLELSGSHRLWMTAGLLLGAYVLLHSVSHGEPIVPRRPLRELPYTLANWKGQERPFPDRVVQATGVTDYTNRIYVDGTEGPVQIYIGYYANQRAGDIIHSPKNCLPGSGWDPIQSGYTAIPISGRQSIVVNQFVIQKDQEKQLVFYWYEGRGRVIASEYSGKFWMIVDAVSRSRTDGALVRVITSMRDGQSDAQARLLRFTQILFPNLDAVIPN
jgi:EpsI family protein